MIFILAVLSVLVVSGSALALSRNILKMSTNKPWTAKPSDTITDSQGSGKPVGSSASSGGGRRLYTGYNIYKGQGAVNVKVIPPTWTSIQDGVKVTREGGLLFEFAPILSPKEYDWNVKTNFFLDVTECGELLAKGPDGCQFVHDPDALTPNAGKIMKTLKWAPAADKSTLFVSLIITDKTNPAGNSKVSIPVAESEFVVLSNVIRYAIPYFLGIDKIFSESKLFI